MNKNRASSLVKKKRPKKKPVKKGPCLHTLLTSVPILCVSCAHDTERREWATSQFTEQGYTFTFLDATDGPSMSYEDFEKEGFKVTQPTKISHKGALGCALSHKRAWKHIVEKEYPWTFVTEDDLYFHENFQELAKTFTVPSDAGLFYLGHCAHVTESQKDEVQSAHPMATHAYLISYKAAAWFLKHFNPCAWPIDIHMVHLTRSDRPRVWKPYAVWNGKSISPRQDADYRGVIFRGIVFQQGTIQRAIKRNGPKQDDSNQEGQKREEAEAENTKIKAH